MPIRVGWDNPEKTTIIYTVDGRWTWNELYNALDQGRYLMDSVCHERVDLIVDMTRCNLLPTNALTHFSRVAKKPHPKAGRMVMVGTTPFIRALLNALGRYQEMTVHPQNVMAVRMLEEARAVLETYRRFDAQSK